MKTKTCTICKQNKPIDNFPTLSGIDKFGNAYRRSSCKTCGIQKSPRLAENRELKEQGLRRCVQCGDIKPLEEFYIDKAKCKPCLRHYDRVNWGKKSTENYKRQRREHHKIRWNTNVTYKLDKLLRRYLRRGSKSGAIITETAKELLGISTQEFKEYIETQFQEGMSWENWSVYGWHLDHIRPISSFNLHNQEERKLCFHYSNLRPLWARDNLSKGSKVVHTNKMTVGELISKLKQYNLDTEILCSSSSAHDGCYMQITMKESNW